MEDKSIKLSPKHGVNPSVIHCMCCGKEYGVALLGKLKDDAKAPRDIYDGLCDNCQKIIALVSELKSEQRKENSRYRGYDIGIEFFGMKSRYEEKIRCAEDRIYSRNGI